LNCRASWPISSADAAPGHPRVEHPNAAADDEPWQQERHHDRRQLAEQYLRRGDTAETGVDRAKDAPVVQHRRHCHRLVLGLEPHCQLLGTLFACQRRLDQAMRLRALVRGEQAAVGNGERRGRGDHPPARVEQRDEVDLGAEREVRPSLGRLGGRHVRHVVLDRHEAQLVAHLLGRALGVFVLSAQRHRDRLRAVPELAQQQVGTQQPEQRADQHGDHRERQQQRDEHEGAGQFPAQCAEPLA
jgi:hypothetical protein